MGSMGLTKEPKENWIRLAYYCDGSINDQFVSFMSGYSYAKNLYQ
jgi:hypothetical protein